MSIPIRKDQEEKLDALKSIIEDHPFGLTLMDIYRDHKDAHNIGSRNTLKNYLQILIDKEEIKKVIIGNYKVFRSVKPPHEYMMRKLYSAMSKVLKDDLASKGEEIGRELVLLGPPKGPGFMDKMMNKNVNLPPDQFKKFFQNFFEKMQKGEIGPDKGGIEGSLFNENREVQIGDGEVIVKIKDSKALSEGAWIHYYIQLGIIKTIIKEKHKLPVSVKIESINEKECIYKYKLEEK